MSSAEHHYGMVGIPNAAAEDVSSFNKNRFQSSTKILNLLSYTLIRASCKHYERTPPLGGEEYCRWLCVKGLTD